MPEKLEHIPKDAEESETEKDEKFKKEQLGHISQLEEPIGEMLTKMEEEIREGRYPLLIGDDVSGRIPALILKEFFDDVADAEHKPHIELMFVAGGVPGEFADTRPDMGDPAEVDLFNGRVEEKASQVAKKIEQFVDFKKIDLKDRKILLVTEAMVTGYSINPLAASVKKLGIPFDIATIGWDAALPNLEVIRKNLGAENIFYGMKDTPTAYRALLKGSKGTEKVRGEVFSKPFRYNSEMMELAREKAREVGRSLADRYLSK